MNVDTKIASKALALRMRKVIPSIINYDQTAYIKGKFVGESIRLIDDILYHAEHENLDGILFAVDMEKALILWNTTSFSLLLLGLVLAKISSSESEHCYVMEVAV